MDDVVLYKTIFVKRIQKAPFMFQVEYYYNILMFMCLLNCFNKLCVFVFQINLILVICCVGCLVMFC